MQSSDYEKMYGELLDHFEGRLPNPEHEPKRFAFFVKMFKYYKYKKGQIWPYPRPEA